MTDDAMTTYEKLQASLQVLGTLMLTLVPVLMAGMKSRWDGRRKVKDNRTTGPP